MIEELISALKEISKNDSLDQKKFFIDTLHEIIDYRIQCAFEERRKIAGAEMILAADSINSQVKSTASTVKSLFALHSAPKPPINNLSEEEIKIWFENYKDWYFFNRENAMKIK